MNIILETQLAWHWKNNNQIKVWAHTTSLSPPFFIEISVRRHVIIKRPCICLLGVSNLPLSMIFILNFRNVPKMWYFLFFILFHQSLQHILFLQQPITSTYPVSPNCCFFSVMRAVFRVLYSWSEHVYNQWIMEVKIITWSFGCHLQSKIRDGVFSPDIWFI
jgi:hypothetical protein